MRNTWISVVFLVVSKLFITSAKIDELDEFSTLFDHDSIANAVTTCTTCPQFRCLKTDRFNNPNGILCICPSGYLQCDSLVSSPCCVPENACQDTSTNVCPSNSVCKQRLHDYFCLCNDGYQSCDENALTCCKDKCSNPQLNTCQDASTSHPYSVDRDRPCESKYGDYSCNCAAGFEHPDGDNKSCIDIDECKGENRCDPKNSVCHNLPGSYRCDCNWGYAAIDQFTCRDINECQEGVNGDRSIPACSSVSSTCSNTKGSYACECFQGYDSVIDQTKLEAGCQDCCVDIDECARRTSACKDICVNGLAEPPINYTCGCNSLRYATSDIDCDDCHFTSWTIQSKCNVTCGSGYSKRKRNTVDGKGRGKPECEIDNNLFRDVPCIRPPCPSTECSLSPWSSWGDCNVSEGFGYKHSARYIVANSENCPPDILLTRHETCYKEKARFDWAARLNLVSLTAAAGCTFLIMLGLGGLMYACCNTTSIDQETL